MSHDPERDAALYLGGAMRRRRSARFEAHLLDCDDCWQDVRVAQRGRALAEAAREIAPPERRERIRTALAALPPHRTALLRPLAAALAGVFMAGALAAGGLLITSGGQGDAQPAPIAAAIAHFREARVPATAPPAHPAPNLSQAGLYLTGTGAGHVGGVRVDAFLYRDRAGRLVLLYLSEDLFPVAAGAVHGPGADPPWKAEAGGLYLLCAQSPRSLLALATDEALLDRVGRVLEVGPV